MTVSTGFRVLSRSQKISELDRILHPYQDLFKPELGELKGTTVKINVDDKVIPQFHKARPIPFLMKDKVTKSDRLENQRVIKPVQFADWAAPTVPVIKSNNEIRLCGDYKVMINSAVKTDSYPLLLIEELYTKLSGGTIYSKLDLSSAYQQLTLDPESQKLTTINTHKGLYMYTRRPFGVRLAPSLIFQWT